MRGVPPFFSGPANRLTDLGPPSKPPNPSRTPFAAFSGQAQRIPDGPGADTLRARAIQRMRELGHQGMQSKRKLEMVERMNDGRRAITRGGARGDVVGPGKRKNEFAQGGFAPRQRIAGEQYSIAD